ncbi:flagellar motor protein MotA [Zavarzinia compransoris]|uniref:flagellar motor protein MotA n=1 Tax=Zavarzinia marina TaxID=2911065 RepID=UPI001F261A0D|nr:flagellar motor protein MotA [Zavarzinia marina]MCF4166803.1 flagellar motor protein MotA [Zavarzinia marina]
MNVDRYLLRMTLFLLAIAGLVVFLLAPASRFFATNVALNSVIIAVALLGVVYMLRQVLELRPEVRWFERLTAQDVNLAEVPAPDLMGPIAAAMTEKRGARWQLGPTATRALVDGLAARLDEKRDIGRYLVQVLIFLGLLGTFWGLLSTVSSIGEAIRNLNIAGGGDFTAMFGELKRGLEAPLSGMGTAFSSSLFGLSGSLILGFLELQASQAQGRFLGEVEDYLTANTRLGGTAAMEGETGAGVPAYVSALLESTAESLDRLQRTMAHAEENRVTANDALVNLTERLATLAAQMRAEQELMVRIAEAQMELKPALQRIAQAQTAPALDEASKAHLRNLDTGIARLTEGQRAGLDEVAAQVKILTRTIAAMAAEER